MVYCFNHIIILNTSIYFHQPAASLHPVTYGDRNGSARPNATWCRRFAHCTVSRREVFSVPSLEPIQPGDD